MKNYFSNNKYLFILPIIVTLIFGVIMPNMPQSNSKQFIASGLNITESQRQIDVFKSRYSYCVSMYKGGWLYTSNDHLGFKSAIAQIPPEYSPIGRYITESPPHALTIWKKFAMDYAKELEKIYIVKKDTSNEVLWGGITKLLKNNVDRECIQIGKTLDKKT